MYDTIPSPQVFFHAERLFVPMNIWSQKSMPIQPRTSPLKYLFFLAVTPPRLQLSHNLTDHEASAFRIDSDLPLLEICAFRVVAASVEKNFPEAAEAVALRTPVNNFR